MKSALWETGGGRMKNYDESRTEENHLELPGFQHMLCVDEVRGSGRWLAVLSIMNGGAKEGSYSSAMISPEDAEQLIKFLNNLLGRHTSDNMIGFSH